MDDLEQQSFIAINIYVYIKDQNYEYWNSLSHQTGCQMDCFYFYI